MNPSSKLSTLLNRLPSPRRALVVRPDLLVAVATRGGTPTLLFGRRDPLEQGGAIRVEALEPGAGLSRVGAVESPSAELLPGELVLRLSSPPTAFLDGWPIEVILDDPSRYRDRISALPGVDALAGKTVVLIGLGSVGSDLGTRLVRLGVCVAGCDPDRLVVENLVRWGLPVSLERDIGRFKARVWADTLAQTVPQARVEGHAMDVVREARAFDELVARLRPDLLIAATDTRDSRRAVNAAAACHQIPALFVSLSDGAQSARIEVVEDARKGPCHLCALVAEGSALMAGGDRGSRMPYAAETVPSAVAVPALPVDIALGTAVATRIALLLLAGQGFRDYLRHGEQEGNVLFFSLQPQTWIFEEAWERLVYQVERVPGCPTCGGGEP
jgi:hypothetical protein